MYNKNFDRKTKDIIKEVLIDYEEARNSDLYLYICYLTKMGASRDLDKLWERKEEYKHLASYTNVSRIRRKLQEEERDAEKNCKYWLIQPKKIVREARLKLEKKYRSGEIFKNKEKECEYTNV